MIIISELLKLFSFARLNIWYDNPWSKIFSELDKELNIKKRNKVKKYFF